MSPPEGSRAAALALTLLLALCGCAGFAVPATASLPPGTTEEFPVTTIYRGALEEIAAGSEGSMWFTQASQYGHYGFLERIAPNGLLTGYYELPMSQMPADLAEGPDRNMWFTANNPQEEGFVGYVTPAGVIEEFSVPNAGPFIAPLQGPYAIAQGSDGNMWFTDTHQNVSGETAIGRVTPHGVVTLYPLASGSPVDIARGLGGDMWFTIAGGCAGGRDCIGRITTSGAMTEFPLPTPSSAPVAITLGADGNMWFAEPAASKIARITPAGGIIEFAVPGVSGALNALTLGADGNIWFTGTPGIDPIGWITPAGTVMSLPLNLAGTGDPWSLAAGFHGDIWFTDPRPAPPETLTTSYIGHFVIPLVPANLTPPTVSGQALEGQALSASGGSWTNEPTTLAYQWQRCDTAGLNCQSIVGANDSAVFLLSQDFGQTLRVVVTAGNVAGRTAAVSAPSLVVQGPPPNIPHTPVAPPPTAPPVVGATMTWRFGLSGQSTVVKALVLHGLAAGGFVETVCRGRKCPFTRLRSLVAKTKPCHTRKCPRRRSAGAPGELSLAKLFKSRSLKPGTQISVSVVNPGWIGKSFVFTIRKSRAPSIRVTCLAPGSTSIGASC